MKATILTDDRIITVTNRIRKAYFIFCFIGVIGVISNISGMFENVSNEEPWQGIINSSLYLIIYIGLRRKTKWLVPLVLISSTWFMLSTFLMILQPALGIPELMAKIVGIMLTLFFAYQMRFFSKKEVKIYFGLEGTVFF